MNPSKPSKQCSERLRLDAASQHLAAIMRWSTDVIISENLDGVIASWNEAAEDVFGYTAAEIIGQPIYKLLPLEAAAEQDNTLQCIRRGERIQPYEGKRITKTGKEIFILLSISPIRNGTGQVVGASTLGRDLGEAKAAEARYRSLARHLQSVREDERTTLARELHDVLGQTLTVIKLNLATADLRLNSDPSIALSKLRAATSHVDQMLRDLRRVASELRPPLLDFVGLAVALRAHSLDLQERTGMSIHFVEKSALPALTTEQSIGAFRIVQESLTNVIRHASATRATVSVECLGHLSKMIGTLTTEYHRGDAQTDVVEIIISDDGVGFAPSVNNARHSLGLLGMEERADAAKGTLLVESPLGMGTRITLRIPVEAVR